MAYWLMVTSEESYNATSAKQLLGFYGNRLSVLLDKTSIGDKLLFYITKKRIVRGLFEITSKPFFDDSPLYGDWRDDEWNQRLKLNMINSEASFDFTVLRWDLDFIKDKGVNYSAYFAPTLIKLSEKDFLTIIEALEISKDLAIQQA